MFDEINSISSPVQKNNWEMAVEVPLIEQFNFNYNVIDPIVDIIFFILYITVATLQIWLESDGICWPSFAWPFGTHCILSD